MAHALAPATIESLRARHHAWIPATADMGRQPKEEEFLHLVERLQAIATDADLTSGARFEIERQVVAACLDSYDALARLTKFMSIYWPDGLYARPYRAALHLGLEAHAFTSTQLFLLYQPIFAAESRFRDFLTHSEHMPLHARLQLAVFCEKLAWVARSYGLEAVLSADQREHFRRVLVRLAADRDAEVGLIGSFGLGVFAEPRAFDELGLTAREQNVAARRRLIADTARFLVGDTDMDALFASLGRGVTKDDPNARASVIRALRLGLRLAPLTAIDAVARILGDCASRGRTAREVLVAASEFAYEVDDVASREALLDSLRPEAHEHAARDPAVRWITGGDARSLRLRDEHLAFVRATRESPRRATASALRFVTTMAAATPSAGDVEMDDWLERILLDSTRLRSALLCVESDLDVRTRVARYHHVFAAVRHGRIRRLLSLEDGAGSASWRDATRRVARVLDASPRFHPAALSDDTLLAIADARDAIAFLFPRFLSEKTGAAIERPLSAALTVAAEYVAIAMPACLLAFACACVFAGSARRLAYVAQASTDGRLRTLTTHLLALSELTAPSSATNGAADPGIDRVHDLIEALRAMSGDLGALGETDRIPLGRAVELTRQALEMTTGLFAVDGRITIRDTWADAIQACEKALAGAHHEAGAPFVRAIPHKRVALAARQLRGELQGLTQASEEDLRVLEAQLPSVLRPWLRLTIHLKSAQDASPRAKSGLRPGMQIGDYELLDQLGAGSFGHVWMVRRRTGPPTKLVLKLPHDRSAATVFVDEAIALLRLSRSKEHPNVVAFRAFDQTSFRLPFLVMDFVPGESLEHRLSRGVLSVAETLNVGAAIASGLAHCHDAGVAHNDIKPANVIFAEQDGRAVIVDFGVATGPIVAHGSGTVPYLAPERWNAMSASEQRVMAEDGRASDVFALACVLYEMRTGTMLLEPRVERDEFPDASEALVELARKVRGGADSLTLTAPVYQYISGSYRVLAARLNRAFGDAAGADVVEIVKRMVHADPLQRPRAAGVQRALSLAARLA